MAGVFIYDCVSATSAAGLPFLKEVVTHSFHMGSSVAVEHFIATAQGVEPFLSVICDGKSVLGALSVAQTHPLAAEALHWKGVPL